MSIQIAVKNTATIYAVINRSKSGGEGSGTRINISPKKHPQIWGFAEYELLCRAFEKGPPKQIIPLERTNEKGLPLRIVNNDVWGRIQKELRTKFEIKTLQLFNGGVEPFLLIAHEEISEDIKKFKEMAKIAKADRVKKAREEMIKDVFDKKTASLILRTMSIQFKFNKMQTENAKLSDLLKLSPNQLRNTKGIGEGRIGKIVNVLKDKELLEREVIV